MVIRAVFALLLGFVGAAKAAEPIQIVWPTPNPAYAQGLGAENYVQPTVSGRVESGFFGCVRNSGTRFHEGVDLKPVTRDRQGEATDPVYSVMPGVVLHVNQVAGNSGYGRYIVVEHRHVDPPVITLYAHLSKIGEEIRAGAELKAGQTIGIMGRSAGGYTIPKERAHVHFEIGFWVSERFQSWYEWKKFGSKNTHGPWNGMNIIGIDPLDFYDRFRDGTATDFHSYLTQLPVAFTVRVKSDRIPDFVQRYPSLARGPMPIKGPRGWEIDFTSSGLPKTWRALAAAPEQKERVRVIEHDPAVIALHRCRNAVRVQNGRATIGSQAEQTLQLLFGFR